MKLDIYCAGMSRGDDLTMIGGCGFILTYVDDYRRHQTREFYYGLGVSNTELCEYQAVRLGLAAVMPAFRGAKTFIHVRSPMVADCLLNQHDSSLQVVAELRRWYSYYTNAKIVVYSEPQDLLVQAIKLAQIGMESQREYDSLTSLHKIGIPEIPTRPKLRRQI